MLRFFRLLRQRLIAKNRFTKYLLYALGEILLVVIGILIALQINNWNEGNKQKQKINTYLANLKKDLDSDIANMDKLKSANMFRFYSLQYLLERANEKTYNPRMDETEIPKWEKGNRIWKEDIPEIYDSTFIHLAFLWTHRVGMNRISLNTIEELKSTGMFSQIPNADLKTAINAYYDECEFRIIRSMPKNSQNINMWQKSLFSEGVVNSDPFLVKDPISLIENNSERAGFIRQMMRGAAWYIEGADEISTRASQLIQSIEKELSGSHN